MEIKYGINISNHAIVENIKKLTNQIYKLLPKWEEGSDWHKPLQTILIEMSGMSEMLTDQQTLLFSILCKLEGLYTCLVEEDFPLFRRTILEILGNMSALKSVYES